MGDLQNGSSWRRKDKAQWFRLEITPKGETFSIIGEKKKKKIPLPETPIIKKKNTTPRQSKLLNMNKTYKKKKKSKQDNQNCNGCSTLCRRGPLREGRVRCPTHLTTHG